MGSVLRLHGVVNLQASVNVSTKKSSSMQSLLLPSETYPEENDTKDSGSSGSGNSVVVVAVACGCVGW